MTETQAGMAQASAHPSDGGPESPVAASQHHTAAAARAAVGRATVPVDNPMHPPADAMAAPKFTRPPGMTPPPDFPQSASGSYPVVVTPGQAGVGDASGADAGGPTVQGAATMGLRTSGIGTGRIPVSGARIASGAARVADTLRGARSTVSAAAGRGPRRARLYIKRIDPWSVMKFSFVVSFVLLIVAVVATSVLYIALDAMGVFDSINRALADMVGATGGAKKGGFAITATGVIFTAALLGTVNVVLFTALATLGAFIYNVCADLVGGVELTLAEKD